MNGRKARELRKKIYGDTMSPKFRAYFRDPRTGQVIADKLRRRYQNAK